MIREPLAVWLYGTRIGLLSERGDQTTLSWTEEAYQRWGGGSRVMSRLLPLSRPGTGPHPRRVRAFIDGLLPEGNFRVNYAMDAGLDSADTYGLIARYGRDTAGALVFQPLGLSDPKRVGHYEQISPAEVGRRLLAADHPSPADPTVYGAEFISLAGMQPKIGLHRDGDQWLACKDGAPSTWIIKLAHPTDSPAADVIDTEVLSTDLARRLGLTTATAEICDFGRVRAIAVSRYDRVVTSAGIARIHQEDLAQALGLDTSDANRKFQRGNTIPSLVAAAAVLREDGTEPDQLLALVTFNHAIGNTDFHAKNISFLRHPDGTATLAPAYDSAMHLHHGGGHSLSALDINGKYRMPDIGLDDLGEMVSRGVVHDTVRDLSAALHDIDRERYSGVSETAFDTVQDRSSTFSAAAADGHHSEPDVAHRRRRGPARS
jgi:serine/threonine-protein kinase HipA